MGPTLWGRLNRLRARVLSAVVAYGEGDESLLAYADQSFIRERHGIDETVSLDDYEKDILQSVRQVDDRQLRPVSAHAVSIGYGILSVTSRYDFPTTLKRIEEAIKSQAIRCGLGLSISKAMQPSLALRFDRQLCCSSEAPGPVVWP